MANGNVQERVIKLRTELDIIQEHVDKDSSNNDLRRDLTIWVQAYNDVCIEEERFLKQRSKIFCLREGDGNSKYFHQAIKGRLNRSKIVRVSAMNDQWFEGADIPNVFVDYYNFFLGIHYHTAHIRELQSLFLKKLSRDVADNMVRAVTDEEIQESLFSIGDDNSPGPDGYTAKFLKSS